MSEVRLSMIEKVAKVLQPDAGSAARAELEVLLYGLTQSILDEAKSNAEMLVDERVYASARTTRP